MEIADNFLESQKEVINSLQSAWAPMEERKGGGGGHYWTTGMMGMLLSPREMADIYARTIGAITDAYVASTRMTTNLVFAGMEAARASMNYARQNAKEAARITSNTTRTFAPTAKETVQVEGEQAGSSVSGISSFGGVGGSAASSFESRGAATTTTTATTEGIAASSSETGSTTAGTGATIENTTGLTEKTRKK
jgi:hypothetical protein